MRPYRPQLDPAEQSRQLRQGIALLVLGGRKAGLALLRLTWIWVRRIGGLLLATLILFEQWGWEPLVALLAKLGHLAPVAAVERWISRLPPYAALCAFVLPTTLLLPLKLLALYLIAHGHAVAAATLFIAAKVVGTAVIARLYQLTEPQLMQIGWVRRAHELLVPRLHALQAEIRSSWAWRYGRIVKAKLKHATRPFVARVKAWLSEFWAGPRPSS